jgi:hypothetical protein
MDHLGSTRTGPPAYPAVDQPSAPVSYDFDPIDRR